MPTPIKLLSLDIDGTLYEPKGSVFDAKKLSRFQLLAKKLRSKGITPIICTGKPANYVEAFAEAYGLLGKMESHVCEHGAVIFVYDTWKERRCIDVSKLYATKDYSDVNKIAEVIIKVTGARKEEKTRTVSINPKDAVTDEFYYRILGIIKGLGYSVLESRDISKKSDTAKEFFSLATAGRRDEEIKAAIQKNSCDFYVSKSPRAVNITPFPMNKAFGLAYVAAKIHNCGLENIVAIADDQGDIPIFDIVGLPVAVANADSETKRFVKEKGGVITKKKSIDAALDVMALLLKYRTVEELRNKAAKI